MRSSNRKSLLKIGTFTTPGQSSTAVVGCRSWFEKNLVMQPPPPPMTMMGNDDCHDGSLCKVAAVNAAVARK